MSHTTASPLHFFFRALSFVTAFILGATLLQFVSFPAAQAAENTDAPSTITATIIYPETGTDITIRAVTDVPIEDSGSTAQLFEVGNATPVASLTEGSTLNFTVQPPTTSFKRYEVRVGGMTSNKVTVHSSAAGWQITINPTVDEFTTDDPTPEIAWTSTPAVNSQSYYALYLVDETTGNVVNTAFSGGGTNGTFGIPRVYDNSTHEYAAYIAKWDNYMYTLADLKEIQASTEISSIKATEWEIETIEVSSSEFSTDENTPVVSITTNQSVNNTNGSLYYYLVNETTGKVVGKGNTGTSWTTPINRFVSGPANSYRVYVAKAMNSIYEASDLQDIRVVSDAVEVSRTAWEVEVTISPTEFKTDDPAPILTATTNQSVSASSYYSYYLVNEKDGSIVTYTANAASEWSMPIGFAAADETQTYSVYIAKNTYPYPTQQSELEDIQAVSESASVNRTPWSLESTISASEFKTDDPTPIITVTANQSVTASYYYSYYLVNELTGQVEKRSTNAADVWDTDFYRFSSGGERVYRAYIAKGTYPYPVTKTDLQEIQVASNSVTVKRSSWTIPTISADKTVFKTDEYQPIITVEANQSVDKSYNYAYFLVNVADGTVERQSAGYGLSFSSEIRRFYDKAPQTYRVYIAKSVYPEPTNVSQLIDIQAQSNTVTVERATWTSSLESSISSYEDMSYGHQRKVINFYGETNQSIHWSIRYQFYLVNERTGYIEAEARPSDNIFVGGLIKPLESSDTYRLYIAGSDVGNPDWLYELKDIQAVSGLNNPTNSGGPVYLHETSGGGNPSEANCNQCTGDPINTATGEFYENDTDLTLNSVIPFNFVRTYSSMKVDANEGMGYGWTHNYNQTITDTDGDSATTTLPASKQLTIIQENGSTVVFNKIGENLYQAPDRAFVTLEYNSQNNEYVMERANGFRFIFDATTGKIKQLKDRNNRVLNIEYSTTGKISRIVNDKGEQITVTWTGDLITSVTDGTRTFVYEYNTENQLTSVTHPNGEVSSYGYGSYNRIISMTQPNGGVTTNTYDNYSRVVSQTDPNGGVMTLSYGKTSDPLRYVTTVTNPDNSVTRNEYNETYQMVKEVLGYGTAKALTSSYEYGSTNQITKKTNPDGSEATYQYDDAGNVVSTTDEIGNTTLGTYNSYGQPLTATDPSGRVTTYNYDAAGNPASVTNAAGQTTTYAYSNGLQTSMTTPGEATTSYGYNNKDVVTSITNDAGDVTTLAVNSQGLPTTVTDSAGVSFTKTYNVNGQTLTQTDPAGNVTEYEYDGSGNLIALVEPDDTETNYEYDLMGNTLSITNANGDETSYVYDSMNRVTSLKDTEGNVSETSYDVIGRPTSVTDALNNTTSYTYNWRGQVLKTTLPSGKEFTNTYNLVGQLVSSTDSAGETTSYTYAPSGETLSVTDAENRTTSFVYDELGRLLENHRPDGSVEKLTYDADGRQTAFTDASNNVATYTYNSISQLTETNEYGVNLSYEYNDSGLLSKQINKADNSFTSYAYDINSNLTNITYSDSTTPISYTYDVNGARASMTDSNGVTTYEYDTLGRVSVVSNTEDGDIGYGYDKNSNLTSLTYPNGNVVTNSYNAVNQLVGVEETSIGSVSYSYNEDSLLESTTFPNGITTTNEFDDRNSLTNTTSKNTSNATLFDFDYEYDGSGLLTAQSFATPTTDNSKEYIYDTLSRINIVTTGGTTDGEYTFDALHNITGKNDGTTLTYNAKNQVMNSTDSSNTLDVGYLYDARGNRTEKTTTTGSTVDKDTFGDNVANQMVEANLGANPPPGTGYDKEITYSYNGDGLRNKKTKTTSAGTSTQKYIWDSNAGIPLLLENSNTVYIYGNGSVPVAQINKDTQNVSFLHSDKLGSIRATSNASGTITSETAYDEYGNVLAGTRSAAFGFAGEYQDADTGYYYLRARWLDTDTGQFTSVDAKLSTTHLAYGYTAGNPLSYTDPLGLDWMEDLGQGALGALDGLTGGLSTMALDAVSPGLINHCSDAFNIASTVSGVASMFMPGLAPLKMLAFAAHAILPILKSGVVLKILAEGVSFGAIGGSKGLLASLPVTGGGLATTIVTGAVALASKGATVVANRIRGNAYASRVIQSLGGEEQKYFSTTLGRRFADGYLPKSKTIIEVKYYQRQITGSKVEKQMRKDAEIVRTNRANEAVWILHPDTYANAHQSFFDMATKHGITIWQTTIR